MRVCRFVLFFLAALIIASCSRIDEVDINSFNQPDGEVLNGTVAVFGNVTTEMRQHCVAISPVHQWGDNQNVLPEINRVFVLCGNDTIPYIEKEADRNKMVFVSEQPFKGETGKTYKLVIETPTGDITAEDYNNALLELEATEREKALARGILDNADENARKLVRSFIGSLLDPAEYDVEFVTGA